MDERPLTPVLSTLDQTNTNRVHSNVKFGEFLRPGLGQRDTGGARHRRWLSSRSRRLTPRGRRIDDDSGLRLLKMLECVSCTINRAVHLELDISHHLFIAQILQTRDR